MVSENTQKGIHSSRGLRFWEAEKYGGDGKGCRQVQGHQERGHPVPNSLSSWTVAKQMDGSFLLSTKAFLVYRHAEPNQAIRGGQAATKVI